jgi:hypothetical protein
MVTSGVGHGNRLAVRSKAPLSPKSAKLGIEPRSIAPLTRSSARRTITIVPAELRRPFAYHAKSQSVVAACCGPPDDGLGAKEVIAISAASASGYRTQG